MDNIEFKIVKKAPIPIVEKESNYLININYGNFFNNAKKYKLTINLWKYRIEGFVGTIITAVVAQVIADNISTLSAFMKKLYFIFKSLL